MQTFAARLGALTVALGLAGGASGSAYINDFDDGDVGPSAVLALDASIQDGAVQLTADAPIEFGTLSITPSEQVGSFTATFDYRFQNASGPTGAGFSFVLGEVAGALTETGTPNGVSVSFDLNDFEFGGPDAAGIAILLNGLPAASAPGAISDADAGVFKPVTVRLDADGTMDLWYDGTQVFADVQTGYAPDPTHIFGFGGRSSSSATAEQRIDDLAIRYNGPTIVNTTTAKPYAQIKDAVDESIAGDVIEVGAGTIVERDIFIVNKDITIRGAGPGATIVDGDNVPGGVFRMINGDSSTIEGLTVRNGVADGGNGGGAVFTAGTTTAVTFVDCRFESSSSGGALFGAVYLERSAATFVRCAFVGNSGGGRSGAHIGVLADGRLTAIQCLFAGGFDAENSVHLQEIGALDPTGLFVNCTFADYAGQSHLRVIGAGAGAAFIGCAFDDSPVFAIIDPTNGAVITADSRNVYPGASGDNIDGVPTFVDAVNGDYRLAANSLGIDAADWDAFFDAGGGLFDLAGAPRFQDDPGTPNTGIGLGSLLDCGAFEFQGSSPPLTPCPGDVDGDGDTDLRDFGIFAGDFGCTPAP